MIKGHRCVTRLGRVAAVGVVLVLQVRSAHATSNDVRGPFVGHVDATSARVWVRGDAAPSSLALEVQTGPTTWRRSAVVVTDAEHDCTAVLEIDGLAPDTTYPYRIVDAGGGPNDRWPAGTLSTAPGDGVPARVKLVFGSCSSEGTMTAGVWARIEAEAPDAVVLLGDTPYIDSPRLERQRRRWRAFTGFEPMARVLRDRSFYATWDDHDFGKNDADGTMKHKAEARRAFLEYHALPPAPADRPGIFRSFRRGPVEVFLVDTRWFGNTEPSPVDPSKLSLLGAEQWQWLTDGLRASDAPFKILASGMIWNDALRSGKKDAWSLWPHELEALFAFIGRHRISGVVLVGGDIHRCRVVRHETRATAGYDIFELISSPMHGRAMGLAKVPHPGLVWDLGEPGSIVTIEADDTVDPPTLSARFSSARGEDRFRFELSEAILRPAASNGESDP